MKSDLIIIDSKILTEKNHSIKNKSHYKYCLNNINKINIDNLICKPCTFTTRYKKSINGNDNSVQDWLRTDDFNLTHSRVVLSNQYFNDNNEILNENPNHFLLSRHIRYPNSYIVSKHVIDKNEFTNIPRFLIRPFTKSSDSLLSSRPKTAPLINMKTNALPRTIKSPNVSSNISIGCTSKFVRDPITIIRPSSSSSTVRSTIDFNSLDIKTRYLNDYYNTNNNTPGPLHYDMTNDPRKISKSMTMGSQLPLLGQKEILPDVSPLSYDVSSAYVLHGNGVTINSPERIVRLKSSNKSVDNSNKKANNYKSDYSYPKNKPKGLIFGQVQKSTIGSLQQSYDKHLSNGSFMRFKQ